MKIITNNQYMKTDKTLEELKEIYIKSDENDKELDDLEFNEIPNVLFYKEKSENGYKKGLMENIFSSVKILVTDFWTLKDYFMEIPDFIEYIVGNNKIYKNNRNKIDFIEMIDDKEEKKQIIRDWIKKDVNYINIEGYSVLIYAVYNNMLNEVKEILNSDFRQINIKNNFDKNILHFLSVSQNDEIKDLVFNRNDINCFNESYENRTIIDDFINILNDKYLLLVINKVNSNTMKKFMINNMFYIYEYPEYIIKKMFHKLQEELTDEEIKIFINSWYFKNINYYHKLKYIYEKLNTSTN